VTTTFCCQLIANGLLPANAAPSPDLLGQLLDRIGIERQGIERQGILLCGVSNLGGRGEDNPKVCDIAPCGCVGKKSARPGRPERCVWGCVRLRSRSGPPLSTNTHGRQMEV